MSKKTPSQRKKDFSSPQVAQTVPHSNEAEQAVLGSILQNNTNWDVVSERVSEADFYTYPHRLIFQEIDRLFKANKPVDILTLDEALKNKKLQDQVGGFAYLAELANNTPRLANIKAYADIVRDNAILRELLAASHSIAEQCYAPEGQDVKEILDKAETKVFEIAEKRTTSDEGPENIVPILGKTIDRIEALYKQYGENGEGMGDLTVTGLDTGFKDLNRKTAGLQPSDLIIIAARPSMGKTTFAMNLCQNIAFSQDKPVLVFSLEMPAEQIMMRMLAGLSRVHQQNLRTGKLSTEDFAKLSQSIEIVNNSPNLYIDDSSGLTPSELRARARRVYREHGGLSMIMVDYLQLMRVPGYADNRTLEIAEISRSLKALAKELEVPVVALSQLNRSLETRQDKRPVNSDLRESGAIEQDADLIMFIYRDEVYNPDSEDKGIAEIIIGKQRNGPIGSIKLSFLGEYSLFADYAPESTYVGSHY